jgi:hypothetical protein
MSPQPTLSPPKTNQTQNQADFSQQVVRTIPNNQL